MANPAPHHQVEPVGLPEDLTRLFFEAWVSRQSMERLGLPQQGSGHSSEGRTASFGDTSGDHFDLRWSGLGVEVTAAVGVSVDTIQTILDDASARVAAGDVGESVVVYGVEMTYAPFDFVSGSLHFARILGDQRHIEGTRRLSDMVLLDFEEGLLADVPKEGLLLAPQSKIQVTIFAPGPGPSDWSRKNAEACAEVVAAVCAVASGRPVEYAALQLQFPAQDDDAAKALGRRYDPAILGLARDSISVDPWGELHAVGGQDAVVRVRRALLAYHAALTQTSTDVAVMLFVTSIEALISPQQEWRKLRVTQRFVKSLVELCPQAVDALLAHMNVEEAFAHKIKGGVNRQRRELLERIYDTRSTPTHTGLDLSAAGLPFLAPAESMRVALLSDLARAAILSFMQAPRSSVIGRPRIDPPAVDPATE